MGNQHPQRLDEGLGQLRSRRFEEFAWHRENTHKFYRITRENAGQLIIAGLVFPGAVLWWAMGDFANARKSNLRGYMQEESPRLAGLGVNKKEYYYARKDDYRRDADPRVVPHTFHPNAKDYEKAGEQ